MRATPDLAQRALAALSSDQPGRRARDFVWGHALHALPENWRTHWFRGNTHTCPLCNNGIGHFLALYRDYFQFCPVCWSLPRHRLVSLFLAQRGDLLSLPHLRLLHIAPEASLVRRFRQIPNVRYLSGDLFSRSAMVRMDIGNIQYTENSFDAIFCSHVLEHVPDDRKAMREFFRVLASGGWALFMVPISANPITDEDPHLTDPAAREKRFGQHDHVRAYGRDFINRLEESGFSAQEISTEDLASEMEIVKLGLTRGEKMFLCHKKS